jgi:RNA polymerase-associated protein
MVKNACLRNALTSYTTADGLQSHRARRVLAANGLNCEHVLVDPCKPLEDLIDLNRDASTPTLVDRDLTRSDCSVVCGYIDDALRTHR